MEFLDVYRDEDDDRGDDDRGDDDGDGDGRGDPDKNNPAAARDAKDGDDDDDGEGPPRPKRQRRFPHVPGNYATHVYAPLACSSRLKERAASHVAHFRRAHGLDLVAIAPGDFHVSLSRSVAIRASQRDTLRAMLRRELRGFSPFSLLLSDLAVLSNDEGLTCFLAITVDAARGGGPLDRAVRCVARAFRRHGLPPYYDSPTHHVSIAWAPGDAYARLAAAVAVHNRTEGQWGARASLASRDALAVPRVCCKIGKDVACVVPMRKAHASASNQRE